MMKPKQPLKTLADVARFMRENFPEGKDFPDREQPPAAEITAWLNQVYADEPSELDPGLAAIQWASLPDNDG